MSSLPKRIFISLQKKFLLITKLMKRVIINLDPNNPYMYASSTANHSSLTLSSLPNDIVLQCLVRVPKRYDPMVSCVSKSIRSLVLSQDELVRIRSLMGIRDNPLLYVCFTNENTCDLTKKFQFQWFTFNLSKKITTSDANNDKNSSIRFSSQVDMDCSTISIGSKIYFIGASLYKISKNLWEYDSVSGKLSKGPSMSVARMLPGLAVYDGKIYVIGGCIQTHIRVEVFDPKTQTWEVGPLSPHSDIQYGQGVVRLGPITEAVAVDEKLYVLSYGERRKMVYDTKDGVCESFEMANDVTWRKSGVCVVDNVIYCYYYDHGLMWYDTNEKIWRFVNGLKLDKSIELPVGMVDCNGKLGLLWGDCRDVSSKKKIWCAMIVLDKSGVVINGKVEWCDIIGYVPCEYTIRRCLGVSHY